jgi:hypothetical protein
MSSGAQRSGASFLTAKRSINSPKDILDNLHQISSNKKLRMDI